jgi:hypothetical protein
MFVCKPLFGIANYHFCSKEEKKREGKERKEWFLCENNCLIPFL